MTDQFVSPKSYDFDSGSLVEVGYLEQVFGIKKRTALKYLSALRIRPLYLGKEVYFSLSTFKRILFVLSRPGAPGFVFPSSRKKNDVRIRKGGYITEVTDEILAQASDPAILAEMSGASGRDQEILKRFVSPTGRGKKKDSDE